MTIWSHVKTLRRTGIKKVPLATSDLSVGSRPLGATGLKFFSMTDTPVTTEAMSREGKGTEASTAQGSSTPTDWQQAQDRFRKGGWFWLATVAPDGHPHVRPVFAAWNGRSFYVASKETARKSRNLNTDPRCTLTHDAGDLHLMIEGKARHLTEPQDLSAASATFAEIYEWPTEVADGKLDAEYGAPTSGGPPYDVYEITPAKAFGFPTDGESFTPTRWRF